MQENQKLQQDVKQLASEKQKFDESTAVKGTKTIISKTGEISQKVATGAFDLAFKNPISRATGQAIYKTAETVADMSQKVYDTNKVADPIMETQAAQTVQKSIHNIKNDVVGITGNPYFAEYNDKEVRERKKQELDATRVRPIQIGADGLPKSQQQIEADDESAGMVMHKSSRLTEAWKNSAMGKTLHDYTRSMEESDNVILSGWRNLKDKFKSEDSEHVKVIKAFKQLDPYFDQDEFLSELAHFIIPELLEASLSGDHKLLAEWCSEGQVARLITESKIYTKAGLKSECKVLDIRNTEIQKMTLLENELPVFVVTFQTNEIIGYTNKAGEYKVGAEDNVVGGRYALAFTKKQIMEPEAENNPKTNNWHIIQWSEVKS